MNQLPEKNRNTVFKGNERTEDAIQSNYKQLPIHRAELI